MTLRQTHTTSNACLISLLASDKFKFCNTCYLQWESDWVSSRAIWTFLSTQTILSKLQAVHQVMQHSNHAFPMVLGSMYMFLWKPRRDCHDIKANTYNVKCMPAFAWPLTNSSFATHVIFSGNPTEFLPGPYEPSSQHKLSWANYKRCTKWCNTATMLSYGFG